MRTSILALASLLLAGCMWETALPDDAAAIHVERGRELLVTDDAVLATLSRNGADGPLSFAHAVARLPLRDGALLAWMRDWSQRLRDEGEPARAAALEERVTCPWLRRAADNHCSASCDVCASMVLRPSDAPFRLIAVVNRTDLSVMPDRAAEGGEGRLVFALTDGASDEASAPALPFTLALEYAQQGPALPWANGWHALGGASEAAFPGALATVAGGFVETGALAQLRTGDALTGPLVLHEFHLAGGALTAATVRNTPRWATVPEAELRAYAEGHAAAIEDGTHVLPEAWRAPSSLLHDVPPAYVASVTSHDALLRGTCGGCHAIAETGFQIDPRAHGEQKLSRFLVDHAKELDEAGRRTQWLQLTLARQ
jgi:hypothetical protein